MGSDADPNAVLDPDCRVRGLQGLRVADASSLPAVPRANNHLSCVMLAEHLAQRMTAPHAQTVDSPTSPPERPSS
jgi:choline dehydrogenase-like flavoprotein